MQESGPAEAVPSVAGLEVPSAGGSEPGSTAMTQAIVVAAEARTSVHNAGRADVKKSKEVVEVPPEAGQEAVRPESQPVWEEPQPQQDRQMEPVVKVERGAVVPPPIV
jgi:hypothetical protein